MRSTNGGDCGGREMKPRKTTTYLCRAVPVDHPLAHTATNGYAKAYEHRLVLFEKIGDGEHTCHWCNKAIYWSGPKSRKIVADHLDGNEWNNSPDNLVSSCWRCNFARVKRPDFLTHCPKGHEYTEENSYYRPDGDGRMCRTCCKERQRKRTLAQRKVIT